MRADERQAAVAYAYAWWMTGDDDTAAAVLRAAMASPEPHRDSDETRQTALMTAIRTTLGGRRPMPAASELALLHDGFGVPLPTAAALAGVPAKHAEDHLASGRLDALLETVRDDFRHPERLGGLAVGNAADIEHAQECRSCSRAQTLFERGIRELQALSAVSAPPGLIASVVAEHAPAPDATPPDSHEDAAARPATESSDETLAAHHILAAPQDYAAAGDDVLDAASGGEADVAGGTTHPPTPTAEELAAMFGDDFDADDAQEIAGSGAAGAVTALDEPDAAPTHGVVAPDEPQAPAEPDTRKPGRVPTTPTRKRTAAVLAGAGVVTFAGLVAVMLTWAQPDSSPTTPSVDEERTVAAEPTAAEPTAPEPTAPSTDDPFGPNNNARPRGFSVTSVGLLQSSGSELAPSGTTIAPDDPVLIAVDYRNAKNGVELRAVWRTNDRVVQRLDAIVSGRESRHVWGVPVPPRGWAEGSHRITVTTPEGLAGAVDFNVRAAD